MFHTSKFELGKVAEFGTLNIHLPGIYQSHCNSCAEASEETALEVEEDVGTSQAEEDESGKWWMQRFSRAGRMGSRPMEVKDRAKPKVGWQQSIFLHD